MIEQINLFPRTTGPKTRKKKVFLETKCRTQRRYKSAVPYLVRILNREMFLPNSDSTVLLL